MSARKRAIICAISWVVVPVHQWGQSLPRASAYRIEGVAGRPQNGDGGPATAAQISGIHGIAADRAGNPYVSDTDNHRVRRISAGGIITTVAGTGLAGYSGDAGPAAQAQLNVPYGLAVDAAGTLYIADLGNNRVRRVAADGIITTVATGAPLATPRNLAIDAGGNLYIAEFDGHRIRRVSPNGTVANIVGTGKAGFSGDGGPPDQAQLAFPAGLAIDRGGALLIADSQNNRVRRIFANGTIGTVLGGSIGTALSTPVAVAADTSGTIYAVDATPGVRALSIAGRWSDFATLATARDLALDGNGNLYIADGLYLRRVTPGGAVTTVAGDGYQHAIGDGGPAQDALLSRPSSVALNGAGLLIIADTGTQRVRQVANGAMATFAAGLSAPMGVAADAAGTVYIADTGGDAIRAVGSDRRVRTVTTQVRGPRGVCLSRGGTLYAVDTGNGRVSRLVAGVETVAAQLNAPEACALDAFGNLYIAETGGHRVRKLSAAGQLTTVAGTGDAGSQGDEGPANAARIAFPRGVAVDDSGNLYIADTGGHRIRLVTPDGMIHTIAGTGDAGFAGDGGAAAGARLNGPAGLLVDNAGAIYFADSGNDRVRRLVPDIALLVLPPAMAVVNALSGAGGPVAAGEIVSITSEEIGAGVELWFDGVAAPWWFAGAGQIDAQVPDTVTGSASTHVELRLKGKVVGAGDVAVADAAPGLLGFGFNEDGWLNTAARPAVRGSLVTLIATGEGRAALPVRVSVAGNPADVVRTEGGGGILLILVRMPSGFIGAGEAEVVLTAGTARSNAIAVWLK